MRKLLSRAEFAIPFLLLLVGAWSTHLAAQQSNSGQAIITTGASEVLADAVVTDRKNHLVTNLKAEDFVITEGGVPQETTSFHIKPSAQCQFRNGDNLIYYFDVYRPQVAPKNKRADVSVELSLKRAGRPMNVRIPGFHVDQWDPDPIPHITLARSIELASLPPGDYALVVEVKDNVASRAVRTQASFSVVN